MKSRHHEQPTCAATAMWANDFWLGSRWFHFWTLRPNPMELVSTARLCHITPRASGTSPSIFRLTRFKRGHGRPHRSSPAGCALPAPPAAGPSGDRSGGRRRAVDIGLHHPSGEYAVGATHEYAFVVDVGPDRGPPGTQDAAGLDQQLSGVGQPLEDVVAHHVGGRVVAERKRDVEVCAEQLIAGADLVEPGRASLDRGGIDVDPDQGGP